MLKYKWNAITGEVRLINNYKVENSRTIIPLKMEAERSCFVIFINRSNEIVDTGYRNNFPAVKMLRTIEGPWQIDFENKQIAPEMINTSEFYIYLNPHGKALW